MHLQLNLLRLFADLLRLLLLRLPFKGPLEPTPEPPFLPPLLWLLLGVLFHVARSHLHTVGEL